MYEPWYFSQMVKVAFSWYLRYTDALVDAAESLKDHQPRILNEVIQARNEKEIVEKYCLAFVQL